MGDAGPVEFRVVANGLSHHVIRWQPTRGNGETVVLCHGLLDLAWSWFQVAEPLAQAGYEVLAFDWRGHGETDWVGPGGYYHFPDYVLDLAQLLPALAEEPIHLIAHSMAGAACVLYAGAGSDRVRTLTLVEGLGPPAEPPDAAPDRCAAFLRTVGQVQARSPRTLASHQAALARMRIQNPELDEDLGLFLAEKATRPAEDPSRLTWRFDPLHQTRAAIPFRPAEFAAFLSRVRVPTLVVCGERGFRLADETERRNLIAGHRFREIPGVGHMVHWFAAPALAEVWLSFCRTAG